MPAPVTPIAWWDFEDDIEAIGYTKDKIAQLKVNLKETSGAVKTVKGWTGNALWLDPDPCKYRSSRTTPAVQTVWHDASSTADIFHFKDNKVRGFSVSAWVYWVPITYECGKGAYVGSEVIRVGLKHHRDDEERDHATLGDLL